MAFAAARSPQEPPGERGADQERAAAVAYGADANGAGGQPAQQHARHTHKRPDQAGSAEHPAAGPGADCAGFMDGR
jgi:hypothetical protein